MMASDLEENVAQLRTEVENLRETERKLKTKEICCQKVKEWFLLKCKTTNKVPEEKKENSQTKECSEDNLQLMEIFNLLYEIKKQKKRLLMLKHQLHCEQVKQDAEILQDMIEKQSDMLACIRPDLTNPEATISPLLHWYTEMLHATKWIPKNNCKGKFSEMNQLFYNISYTNGEKQPVDLLAEKINERKIKHDQRSKGVIERLQFSTCHKGFCVQIVISRPLRGTSNGDGNTIGLNATDGSPYQFYLDMDLEDVHEHLLEHLTSRKSPEIFVRKYVWEKIERLVS